MNDETVNRSDIACTACGYSLRGLAVSGVCPECGASIREMFVVQDGQIVGPRQAASMQPLLHSRSFHVGVIVAVCYAASVIVGACGLIFSEYIGAASPLLTMLELAQTPALIAAVFLLTPPATAAGSRGWNVVRLCARWSQVGMLPTVLLTLGMEGAFFLPAMIMGLLAWVGVIMALVLLQRVARHFELADAQRHFRFVAISAPITVLAILLIAGVAGGFGATACVFLVLLLGIMAWWIWVNLRLLRGFWELHEACVATAGMSDMNQTRSEYVERERARHDAALRARVRHVGPEGQAQAMSTNIETDQPCLCGYNLRGLLIGRNCPECGEPIIGGGGQGSSTTSRSYDSDDEDTIPLS
jgi:predicted RNA-binding Zn-ribbon protein involved in translation (DUF1610 family)